ncbi:MAG: agmatinase [Acidaminococcaceae bacterium]|jgi:agmatinase|nr:agmatinase [Acidaminococcaceae bacterium]MCI2110093.1 agmatinase [Acidaminococcaceae bacterium]
MENFSLKKSLNMSPTGIASFAKSEICVNINDAQADIAVLGAPFDMDIQGRSGCRMGPRGIREGSTRFGFKPGGTYNFERDTFYMDADKWKVIDCGDVDYIPGDPGGTAANLTAAVEILASKGIMPVILGGDCSVSYPMMQGLNTIGTFDVIHFDAHLDWTKPLCGQKYFNGAPMRNVAGLPYVGRILHLGLRGQGSSGPDDFQDARKHGDGLYTVKAIHEMGIARILDEFKLSNRVVIHFDIDVMDASCAPATASPMFGGFMYDEVVDMFEAIAAKTTLAAMVMTEVAPPYDDQGGTTSYLAARLIADMLGFATKEKESKK